MPELARARYRWTLTWSHSKMEARSRLISEGSASKEWLPPLDVHPPTPLLDRLLHPAAIVRLDRPEESKEGSSGSALPGRRKLFRILKELPLLPFRELVHPFEELLFHLSRGHHHL